MADNNEMQRIAACGKAFSPAAPINNFQLFKGRKEQLQGVISAVTTRGKHVVLFGDRGVGKTSLANILKDAMGFTESLEVVKVNCNSDDTYSEIWKRALAEIYVLVESPNEAGGMEPVEYQMSAWLEQYPLLGSGDLKKVLSLKCDEHHELIFIFDEVDRLPLDHRQRFADLLKDLSDSSTNATILLIGVANNFTDLIDEHKSIERCVGQIFMPPMAKFELCEIIDMGLRTLQMKIEPEAKDIIVALSRGYPYYTHLLCYEASVRAIKGGGVTIRQGDIGGAIKDAIRNASVTVKEDYSKGADGQRKGTKFPLVLLASALAETDDFGYFRPTDMQIPKAGSVGPDYSEHLNKLATDESRGLVLERRGSPRKYKYRFRNPLLKPYIIMKGISDGLVGGGLLAGMGGDRTSRQMTMFDDFE